MVTAVLDLDTAVCDCVFFGRVIDSSYLLSIARSLD